MALTKMMRALVAIAAISGTAAAYAQAPAKPAAATPPKPAEEPKLVFDREVYSYAANARRDPFKPLAGKESMGPLFEDLKLRGIIYSSEPTLSLVLLQDGSKRLYRLHRGEVVGNSRIVEVKQLSVRFAVENFGQLRYEELQLRAPGSGYAYSAPAPAQQTSAQGQSAAAATTAPPSLPPRVEFPNNDPARSRQLVDSVAKDAREKRAQQQKDQKQPVSETPR